MSGGLQPQGTIQSTCLVLTAGNERSAGEGAGLVAGMHSADWRYAPRVTSHLDTMDGRPSSRRYSHFALRTRVGRLRRTRVPTDEAVSMRCPQRVVVGAGRDQAPLRNVKSQTSELPGPALGNAAHPDSGVRVDSCQRIPTVNPRPAYSHAAASARRASRRHESLRRRPVSPPRAGDC